MKPHKTWIVLVLGLFAWKVMPCSAQQRYPETEQSTRIVVLVEKTPKGTVYHVDSKEVTGDPLRGIAEAYEKHGSDTNHPIVAIVDERLPMTMLDQIRGLIGKVGLVNVRYFLLTADREKVGEISFGRVFPYPSAVTSGPSPH